MKFDRLRMRFFGRHTLSDFASSKTPNIPRIVFFSENPTQEMMLRVISTISDFCQAGSAIGSCDQSVPDAPIMASASLSRIWAFIQSTQGPLSSDHFSDEDS